MNQRLALLEVLEEADAATEFRDEPNGDDEKKAAEWLEESEEAGLENGEVLLEAEVAQPEGEHCVEDGGELEVLREDVEDRLGVSTGVEMHG